MHTSLKVRMLCKNRMQLFLNNSNCIFNISITKNVPVIVVSEIAIKGFSFNNHFIYKYIYIYIHLNITQDIKTTSDVLN